MSAHVLLKFINKLGKVVEYEGRFLCSKRGRYNKNGESKCIHPAYIWKD